MRYKNWFFDFDDTLATGAITWGIKYAFPQLVQRHQLAFDETLFHQALFKAQAVSSSTPYADPMPILQEMFETMGWSLDLRNEFLTSLQLDYIPEMYEDVLPFIQQLKEAGCRIFVVSNNPSVPLLIQKLPLEAYIERVFTPKLCGCMPKPDPCLWKYILNTYPELEPDACVLVGDDPWSEGAFAQNCNLPCWIIDRLDRFTGVEQPPGHKMVGSLAEILF